MAGATGRHLQSAQSPKKRAFVSEAAIIGAMSRKAQLLRVGIDGDTTVSGLLWKGKGRPIVALHGLFDSSAGWAEVAARTERPIWAFDLPGFVYSSPVDGPNMDAYAERVASAIDKIGVRNYTLVGHSFGGAISSHIVASGRSNPHELLLVAPAGYGRLPLAQFFNLPGISSITSVVASRAAGIPPLADFAYTHFVAGGHRPEGDLVRRLQLLGPDLHRSLRQAISALARSGGDLEENFWSGSVTCVWGRHDHLVPESHMKTLQKLLPQTEMIVWEDTAHHPQAEHPERFCNLLVQQPSFIERTIARPLQGALSAARAFS